MMVWEIEITRPGTHFWRVTAAYSRRDTDRIERYWKSRGYRVSIDEYELQHRAVEFDINSKYGRDGSRRR